MDTFFVGVDIRHGHGCGRSPERHLWTTQCDPFRPGGSYCGRCKTREQNFSFLSCADTLPKIVGATAQQLSAVIAGSALLGIGTGGIFASYAGIAEALPNKYR